MFKLAAGVLLHLDNDPFYKTNIYVFGPQLVDQKLY